MKINDLKNLREKEIKARQEALKEGWRVVLGMTVSGIISGALLEPLGNVAGLGLFLFPIAVLSILGAVIGLFVMLYKSANFKK